MISTVGRVAEWFKAPVLKIEFAKYRFCSEIKKSPFYKAF